MNNTYDLRMETSMNETVFQFIGTASTIILTGLSLSKVIFKRMDTIETTFVASIRRINENLVTLEKGIAINTALIDQILKRGYSRGE